jgi:hypothetical protein
MKSFLRRSKCDRSTLRKVELIARRGYFRRRARHQLEIRGRLFQRGEHE